MNSKDLVSPYIHFIRPKKNKVILAFYRANKFSKELPQTFIIIKYHNRRDEKVKYKVHWLLTRKKNRCILLANKKNIYLYVFLTSGGECHKDRWFHFLKQVWIPSAKIHKRKNDFLHVYINKKWVTSPKIQNDYQNRQDTQEIVIIAIL